MLMFLLFLSPHSWLRVFSSFEKSPGSLGSKALSRSGMSRTHSSLFQCSCPSLTCSTLTHDPVSERYSLTQAKLDSLCFTTIHSLLCGKHHPGNYVFKSVFLLGGRLVAPGMTVLFTAVSQELPASQGPIPCLLGDFLRSRSR